MQVASALRRFVAKSNRAEVIDTLGEITSWLEANPQASLGALEDALARTKVHARSPNYQNVVNQIFLGISDQLDRADSRTLVRLVQRGVSFGMREEFFVRASEVALAKGPNAFSPEDISSLALGLVQGGIREMEIGNFIRRETAKFLPDLSIRATLRLLETERRNFQGDRKFLDQLIERLGDSIDRMTAGDVTLTLGIFSKFGLGRGFITRRLMNLTTENMQEFSLAQKISVFTSLARLRFLGDDQVRIFLEAVIGEIGNLSMKEISDLMLGLGIVENREVETKSVVRTTLLEKLESEIESIPEGVLVDALWGICAVTPRSGDVRGPEMLPPAMAVVDREEDNKTLEKARKLLEKTLETRFIEIPKHRSISLKLLEIGAYLNFPIKANLRVDEAEKIDAEKAEISRMHAEFQIVLDSFKGRSFTRGVLLGNFRVDFFDEKNKLAIDLDSLSRPVTRILRGRVLGNSVKYHVVDYWKWRTLCRSSNDQLAFVKSLLT